MQIPTDLRVQTRSALPTVFLPQSYSKRLIADISHSNNTALFFKSHFPYIQGVEYLPFREETSLYARHIQTVAERAIPKQTTALAELQAQEALPPQAEHEPAPLTQHTIDACQFRLPDFYALRLIHGIAHTDNEQTFPLSIVKQFVPRTTHCEQVEILSSLLQYSKDLQSIALNVSCRLDYLQPVQLPAALQTSRSDSSQPPIITTCAPLQQSAPPQTMPIQSSQIAAHLAPPDEHTFSTVAGVSTTSTQAHISSRISVTTGASQTSTASATAALSTATTHDLKVLTGRQTTEHLSTVIPATTHYFPTPQQRAAPHEPQPFVDEPGPSTTTPIERPLSVQSSSTTSSKSHPTHKCDDLIERPLISSKRGLAVKNSPVHDGAKGVFLRDRTCEIGELIADYEGTFVFRYPLRQRFNTFLMSTSVSLKKKISFLPDERYVSWSEIYFYTGDNFLEIGILGKKAISFINHSDNNANSELVTKFDKKVTHKRKSGSRFLLCVSREKLDKLLGTLHVQVIATKKINDQDEILCKYTTKQQKKVDFKNYIVMPTKEEEEEEFTNALQASAKDAPESDSEPNTGSESDDSSSDSDSPSTHQKIFPKRTDQQKKRAKRKPPQAINIANISKAYGDFDSDILTPLREKFQGNAFGHLYDITNAIENDDQNKKWHEKVLTLIGRHIILPKTNNEQEKTIQEKKIISEARELGIEEEETDKLLSSTAKVFDQCFDISLEQWERYIDSKETFKHTEHKRKRIKVSSSTDVKTSTAAK